MRTVNGLKVTFMGSEVYFSGKGQSMATLARETGADIVILLAAGKTESDVTDEEIAEVLADLDAMDAEEDGDESGQ